MVQDFAFNLNWDFSGGKRIAIRKFKTIRYTYGLYFSYDNHRGKKGELCRYSTTPEDSILAGVCDVDLKAKKLKNPVLETTEELEYVIYIKDKKVQFIK